MRFLESPHPNPLPQGEGAKAAIRARIEYISAITLAELVHGVEKSQLPARNMAVVEDFCSRLIILPYGDTAAYHYGSIRAVLEQAGQTIGVNDLHIAAQARSQGLILVSNNLREFKRVPGLLLENWLG